MSNTKKFVITSITLGAIAAASAGLISVTNLITRDQIAKNEKDRITAGITRIFGQNASISSEKDVSGFQYLQHLYEISGEQKGYAYRATGSNNYGKISLIIGFKLASAQYNFSGMYVVVNEQTYATTLVDNYINPVNAGDIDYSTDESVKCGATYGAKLVRSMIDEATAAVNQINK